MVPTISKIHFSAVKKSCEGEGLADAQREQGVGVAPLAARPALGKLLKACTC